MYDIIVVGGGPAGMTAALYALRANKTVLVIEKATFGGQITYSPKVENYPGFAVMSGNEFAEKLIDQILGQGAEVELGEVREIKEIEGGKQVITEDSTFKGKAVIIATGARHRMLGLENEEKFVGEGISFCAVCDGAFYKGKHVGVVGGGNSALQEALLLADIAGKVTVIQNLDFLTGEEKLQQQLRTKDNVEILLGTTVQAYLGQDSFEGVMLHSQNDGKEQTLPLDGLFIAIGLVPQNEAFSGILTLDEGGYAKSSEDCITHTKGIFVAGDCRTKKVRQVATAVGDGAVAGLAACAFLDSGIFQM